MAEKMFISEQTVKNHLHNIFDKLGVSDRLELALYAIHKGLAPRRPITVQSGRRFATIGMHAYLRLRSDRHRIGSGGPAGGDSGRQTGQTRRHHRAQDRSRRRQRQHRHDPQQDIPRSSSRPVGFPRTRRFTAMSYTVKQNITIEDLLLRTDQVIRHEIDVIAASTHPKPRGTDRCNGFLQDPHTIKTQLCRWPRRAAGDCANIVVVATGTEATMDPHIPFDGGGSSPATTSCVSTACRERSRSSARAWSAASTPACSPRSACG